jgi:hypothetical protein
MSDTSFDEARRCPTCQQPGLAVGQRPADSSNRRAGTLHIFRCANERCAKHDRDWIIQVRPDGTIPEPTLNREKSFNIDRNTARERIAKARAGVDSLVRQSLEK